MKRKTVICPICNKKELKSMFSVSFHLRWHHNAKFVRNGQFTYVRGALDIALWRWLSLHLKKYFLLKKNGFMCSLCGYNKRRKDGGIILEIDHIDGNHNNEKKSNLRILCPNCHALTPNFRNWGNTKNRKRSRRNFKYMKERMKKINPARSKFHISKRKLRQLVWSFTVGGTGKIIGVSHTSIRKRCVKYGIKMPGHMSLKNRKIKYKELFKEELIVGR